MLRLFSAIIRRRLKPRNSSLSNVLLAEYDCPHIRMATGKSKNSEVKVNYKGSNGGVLELLKELWNAAVALRGSIEPAVYKRYVLPLIFLRFLSLRYEKRVSEIDAEIADPKSDFFTTDKQLAMEFREGPDNFKKKNVFLVPEEARWANIVIRESRTLAALRDTLLPKLLSGELQVKSAEKLVEAK